MPTYILYLTGSYKSEYRAWEIERLVRKMLLSLFTTTIPVSYSPALQMLVVSNILVVSMVLHYYFMPYKVSWTVLLNWSGLKPLERACAILWHGVFENFLLGVGLADSKCTCLQ